MYKHKKVLIKNVSDIDFIENLTNRGWIIEPSGFDTIYLSKKI